MKLRFNKLRKIYEPTITEDMVVTEIMGRAMMNGIRLFRIVERIPIRNPFGRIRGRFSTPGIPDLIGWANKMMLNRDGVRVGQISMPVFIECKRPGGHHRFSQEHFIEEAKTAGCVAFFAESWDDCLREFMDHGIIEKDKTS